jgi:phosphoribosylamine--glycine ligase/phosphoribosylaminoimidazole synthetase
MTTVVILGNGIRESAIETTLRRTSPNITTIQQTCNVEDIKDSCSLVIVGPEKYLADGVVDDLQIRGIPVFGPTKAAARIETSKVWSKEFMKRHKIQTAPYSVFREAHNAFAYINEEVKEYPIVVKADGLCNGKGVIIAYGKEEAKRAVTTLMIERPFGEAGTTILIEKYLMGAEVSLMAFCDGVHEPQYMPSAQDYKRAYDGNHGPNTGGMGAMAPSIIGTTRSGIEIIRRCYNGLKEEGTPFKGILFAGLIYTPSGCHVLEFNARFGSPETTAVLSLFHSDLFDVLLRCANGTLNSPHPVKWSNVRVTTVVVAQKDYPSGCKDNKTRRATIKQLQPSKAWGVTIGWGTGGSGRLMTVTSETRRDIYAYLNSESAIKMHNCRWRTDIGQVTRVLILSSPQGTSVRPILRAIWGGRLRGVEILCVCSTEKEAPIFNVARHYGISTYWWRGETKFQSFVHLPGIERTLLIGWKRIISPKLIKTLGGSHKIWNVHPSLLPKHGGLFSDEVHRSVLECQDKVSGCTIHEVEAKVDAGRIVYRKICPVIPGDTIRTLKARVQRLEGEGFINLLSAASTSSDPYFRAGVDLNLAKKIPSLLQDACSMTDPKCRLGGFGGKYEIDPRTEILVAGTDGVGTKLEFAMKYNRLHTIGMDLVAMNVNDVYCHGAKPAFFLNHIAGQWRENHIKELVMGMAKACKWAGCSLIGGETSMERYPFLSGTCVGVTTKNEYLPKMHEMEEGDLLLGYASNGIHANGFSLIREAIGDCELTPNQVDMLMVPTRLYTNVNQASAMGYAHITGGGLEANIKRILPPGLTCEIMWGTWKVPPVFDWVQTICNDNVSIDDMRRIFNMGIGYVAIAKKTAQATRENFIIGHLIRTPQCNEAEK